MGRPAQGAERDDRARDPARRAPRRAARRRSTAHRALHPRLRALGDALRPQTPDAAAAEPPDHAPPSSRSRRRERAMNRVKILLFALTALPLGCAVDQSKEVSLYRRVLDRPN